MARKEWVWMGRPAHFIAAESCHYRLATFIPASKVIVSTVGDYDPLRGMASEKMKEFSDMMKRPADIGCDRKYETMVFRAVKAKDCDGCPWHINVSKQLDMAPAKTANEAQENHYRLCWKYDRRLTRGVRR